jgi:DNA repair protein RecO (recombination protein O)
VIGWRAEGILLTARPHGETAAIVEVFTAEHGRHAGVVRGGGGRRMAPLLQPGAQLALEWRARLDTHIGAFRVEPLRDRAGGVLGDPAALAALRSVTALCAFALPERAAHPALYARTLGLLDALAQGAPGWPLAYLRWEMALLEESGFGLDLSHCAATGQAEDLAYVSPRTGRAVSRAGAGGWADRLLPLPAVLTDGPPRPDDLADGLRLTGHFLDRWLAPALGDRPLPEARARCAALLLRAAAASGGDMT